MSSFASGPDHMMAEAVQAHQAGQLARAEQLYRQVMALRPDWAEACLNLGLAQLGQRKQREAVETLRRAIRLKPGLPKAHYHLGGALAGLERFGEAAMAYRQAIELQPDLVEAHNNLGNALICNGEFGGAIEAYRRTLALRPDFVQAHNNLGWAFLQAGRAAEAEPALAEAVVLAPTYAEAHNNHGRAFHALKRHAEAATAFRTALALVPDYAEAHANLSATLYDAGDAAASEAAARDAVRLNPAAPEAHLALGNAIRFQGRAAASEAHYREALRVAPAYVEGYKHLGLCLQEQGRYPEAFAAFDYHAAHISTVPPKGMPPSPIDPAHKERHDAERVAWIAANPAEPDLNVGGRVPGRAVDPANRIDEISRIWESSSPQAVAIDGLLTPPALDSLRQYCLRTEGWHESFERGYLGAVPERGFTPPIIAQLAEELRAVYPAIIGEHPLMYFWGFKYDSSLHGIRVHADFAAVNVNFWITPDEANLDPDSGGLVIHDVDAPLDWTFEKYNAADDEIRALIAEKGAAPVTVPYRANRAAIFNSDLFHETDTIRFKPGYENRRINVTLLFGRREDRARAGA